MAYKSSSKPQMVIANVYPHQHFIDPRTKWWHINANESGFVLHDIGIDLSLDEVEVFHDDKNIVLTGRKIPDSEIGWLRKRFYSGFDSNSKKSTADNCDMRSPA